MQKISAHRTGKASRSRSNFGKSEIQPDFPVHGCNLKQGGNKIPLKKHR